MITISQMRALRHRTVVCAGLCPPRPTLQLSPATLRPEMLSYSQLHSPSSSGFQLDSANGDTGRRRGGASLGFLPAGHCSLFWPQLPSSALVPGLHQFPSHAPCPRPVRPRSGPVSSAGSLGLPRPLWTPLPRARLCKQPPLQALLSSTL